MRILFTFAGGTGHFLPLVPVAGAAAARGHDVLVATRSRLVETVARTGLPVLDLGGPTAAEESRVRQPLLPLSRERERQDVVRNFIGKSGRERAAVLIERLTADRPDLVVCDEADFGAMVAADRLGIPRATVLVLAAGTLLQPDYLDRPVEELYEAFDTKPAANPLTLSPIPPGFRAPDASPYPRMFALRPAETLPEPAPPHERPKIYFTLGTEFNLESGDLFERVLAGLRTLDADIVMTVGRHIDPREFGPQPGNVTIERFIPQDTLLPTCDLVISHGGSGSVLGAIAHGLPMLVAPMGADQPDNADRVRALGLGDVLDAERVTPGQAASQVSAVLGNPACRRAVLNLRAEMAALPGPAEAVALLEAAG